MIYKTLHTENEYKLNKPVYPIILLALVMVVGMVGYSILWHDTSATLLDAFYMTFITVATIGYSEVYPLDAAGKVFTIVIALIGIGSLFYILGSLMENLVVVNMFNNREKKKMKQLLDKIADHIIVVGHGNVGRLTIIQLLKNEQKVVCIDHDFSQKIIDESNPNCFYIEGDATDEAILELAGIKHADGLIITAADPAASIFVALTARELNPNIYIVARSSSDKNIAKLIKAGANRTVNPYNAGGQRMANMVINKSVIDFLETNIGSNVPNLAMETIDLPNNCPLFNKSLHDLDFRKATGVTVLAVLREGDAILNPQPNFKILRGDKLLVFGTLDSLKKLTDWDKSIMFN
jgi:voltage-gated potassium channel